MILLLHLVAAGADVVVVAILAIVAMEMEEFVKVSLALISAQTLRRLGYRSKVVVIIAVETVIEVAGEVVLVVVLEVKAVVALVVVAVEIEVVALAAVALLAWQRNM